MSKNNKVMSKRTLSYIIMGLGLVTIALAVMFPIFK